MGAQQLVVDLEVHLEKGAQIDAWLIESEPVGQSEGGASGGGRGAREASVVCRERAKPIVRDVTVSRRQLALVRVTLLEVLGVPPQQLLEGGLLLLPQRATLGRLDQLERRRLGIGIRPDEDDDELVGRRAGEDRVDEGVDLLVERFVTSRIGCRLLGAPRWMVGREQDGVLTSEADMDVKEGGFDINGDDYRDVSELAKSSEASTHLSLRRADSQATARELSA
jgi:hypothetical protein